MKSTLKILMAYSEISPFSKTGGLGDVGGALPKALKELGHDVRLITPQYRVVNERKYILREVIRLQNIEIPVGREAQACPINVKSAFLPGTKVQVYFLDYKPFFGREGLYTDPATGKDFPDNAARFALFCRGSLETLKKLQWQPDIIHCNDWQTGLIPFFLKTHYRGDPFYSGICSQMTVHSFAFQGNFGPSWVSKLGLNPSDFYPGSPIENHGQISFLKAGIEYADVINTVSETYARESLSSSEFGCGMEGVLKVRKRDYSGILNGADYQVWDPMKDSRIPKVYGPNTLEAKEENKKALCEQFGLPYDAKRPVVATISRLTDQKGFNLIRDAYEDLMRTGAYYVLLGLGDTAYQRFFEKMKKKYPDQTGINYSFDETLSHLIMAGADMFLMPSSFEPCGLTQLYGLKYGTVPVVRKTGGLADTVEPVDPATGKGTGFVFEKAVPEVMMAALRQAVQTFADKKAWLKIMKNGMKQDYSWAQSARKYVQGYSKCMSKSR
jgi:starch synthase